MDAWSTKFEARSNWLNSKDACEELDKKLAALVGPHWKLRGASPAVVLPMQCAPTAAALRALGPSPSSSIHCTILLALLGELLLCAEEGGILRKDTVAKFVGDEQEREALGEATRLLRNAVCHPASATEHDEVTGIASLAGFVAENFKEEKWASGLRSRPADLGKREVAFFALGLVVELGWDRAARWGVKLKGAKPPHTR
jgi:hypothetical protein